MSINFAAILSALQSAFAPKATVIPSVAASVLAAGPVTVGELTAGLKDLPAFFSAVEKAASGRLGDLQSDAVAAEQVAQILADLGVPFAGDANIAIKVAAFLLSNAPSASISPGQGDLSYENSPNFKDR